jgi:hypothetical protein
MARSVDEPTLLPLIALLTFLTVLDATASVGPDAAWVPAARETVLPTEPGAASESITADALLRHVRILASDEFEGRAPGTRGEVLTVEYLVEQFRRMGLEPGNPDGTYTQAVPLVGQRTRARGWYEGAGGAAELRWSEDFLVRTSGRLPAAWAGSSDVVFVGYGMVVPELGRDDYGGADVRGRTLLMLSPNTTDTARLGDTVYEPHLLARHASVSHRLDLAAERGASAVALVHRSSLPYTFELMQSLYTPEQLHRADREQDREAGAVTAQPLLATWLREEVAAEMVAAGGHDLDALERAARGGDFRLVPLAVAFGASVETTTRSFTSSNVVARLPGAHARLRHETVVYTAHWDHLGRDTTLAGDQIYNGAIDNAGGTAQLLEIARAFTRLPTRPGRSIVFMGTTAEEAGLLGAHQYVENPLYPLEETLAVINLDWFNPWGRTTDVLNVTRGNTTLDEVLERAALLQDRVVASAPELEQMYFARSDHFAFAGAGVPALFGGSGVNVIGQPPGYGQEMDDLYMARDYHQVSDEVKADWDLAGAVEDARLLFTVGWLVAEGREPRPEWKADTPHPEFGARRQAR